MNLVVTHLNPDLDAVASVWLIKRFLSGWQEAEVKFVPAGEKMEDSSLFEGKNVLHVDTGLTMLDHHTSSADTCSARLTLDYLKKIREWESEALERLVNVVNGVDHFREVNYPNPLADFYDFNLKSALDGWNLLYKDSDSKFVEWGMTVLDGIYRNFENKVWAEKEIKNKGIAFETKWGKAFGAETINDDVISIGQKQGFVLVVRKDPKKGHVRIKARPDSEADLTETCGKLKEMDPEATWFLHMDKHQLLNGSSKNPKHKPTRLSLEEIMEVLKQQ